MRLGVRISIDASELNRIPNTERYYYIKRELCAQFGVELMRRLFKEEEKRANQFADGVVRTQKFNNYPVGDRKK